MVHIAGPALAAQRRGGGAAWVRSAPTATLESAASYAAALMVFVFYSNDAFAFFGGQGPATTALYGVTYLVMLVLCARAAPRVFAGVAAAWPLALLYVLDAGSLLWSADPSEGLSGTIAFMLSALLGFYVGSMLSLRGVVLFAAWGCVVLTAMNLIAVGILPTARGDPESAWPDTWRGLHLQKNNMGAAMAMASLLCAYAAATTQGWMRAAFATAAAAAGFLLIMAESVSALLVGLLIATVGATGALFRRAVAPWLLMLGFAAVVVFVSGYLLIATGVSDSLFLALGRQPTMSARLPIWETAWRFIEQRPLLGWGSDFWDEESARLQSFVRDPLILHYPKYAHNGYVDTLDQTGAVGLVLLLSVIALYARNLFLLARARPQATDLIALGAFLLYLLVANITEGFFMLRGGMWFFFAATMVRMSLLVAELRRQSLPREPLPRHARSLRL
jgi:O-antigen ligase